MAGNVLFHLLYMDFEHASLSKKCLESTTVLHFFFFWNKWQF